MILKGKEQTADQLGTSDPKEQPSGQFSRFSFCLMYLGLGVEKLATLKQQQTLPPPKKTLKKTIFSTARKERDSLTRQKTFTQ